VVFAPDLRHTVWRKADFRCCICRAAYVEVHHIIPESEGGPDTEDNAAPLCPTCHEMWGANPTKRNFIREARDAWYEFVEAHRKPENTALLEQINQKLSNVVTKEDLGALIQGLPALIRAQIAPTSVTLEQARDVVAYVTGSALSSVAAFPVEPRVAMGDIFRMSATEGQRAPNEISESKKPVP
jgi:hypothetical protein